MGKVLGWTVGAVFTVMAAVCAGLTAGMWAYALDPYDMTSLGAVLFSLFPVAFYCGFAWLLALLIGGRVWVSTAEFIAYFTTSALVGAPVLRPLNHTAPGTKTPLFQALIFAVTVGAALLAVYRVRVERISRR